MRDEGLDTLTIGFAMYYLRDPGSAPKPLDTDFFRFTRSAGRSKAFINLREASIVTKDFIGYLVTCSIFKDTNV